MTNVRRGKPEPRAKNRPGGFAGMSEAPVKFLVTKSPGTLWGRILGHRARGAFQPAQRICKGM